jgi:hypothetical protein
LTSTTVAQNDYENGRCIEANSTRRDASLEGGRSIVDYS